jgi:hypothetical protein
MLDQARSRLESTRLSSNPKTTVKIPSSSNASPQYRRRLAMLGGKGEAITTVKPNAKIESTTQTGHGSSTIQEARAFPSPQIPY